MASRLIRVGGRLQSLRPIILVKPHFVAPPCIRWISTTPRGPAQAYDNLVDKKIIQNDAHQRGIVELLSTLYEQLDAYRPPPIVDPPAPKTPSVFSRFFGSSVSSGVIPPIPPGAPKGLYLYGSVGCGKSFLMDLLYANLPEQFANDKRRIHFHAFMQDVHLRGHKMKQKLGLEQDWIVHVARDLAREARVLCFDEFQVTDIADAMILRRLMETLMGYGVVAVMTSNREPDELYKNGIQREQFIPCIELIKKQFVIKCLDSDIDYRRLPRALSRVYFSPANDENHREFDKLFHGLAGDGVIENRKVTVWGRDINVPFSSEKVALFPFSELCGKPHSASDYLAITNQFNAIFIKDIPRLGLDTKDQARRFILFLDAAYEAKTKMFMLSDPPVEEIFSDKRLTPEELSAAQLAAMDELGLSADQVSSSSIFTGEEEIFAFARALSRISEMGGVQWATQSKT